jgi:hypothetical protein
MKSSFPILKIQKFFRQATENLIASPPYRRDHFHCYFHNPSALRSKRRLLNEIEILKIGSQFNCAAKVDFDI